MADLTLERECEQKKKNKKKKPMAECCADTNLWFLWQPDCFVLITGVCGLCYRGGGVASWCLSLHTGMLASAARSLCCSDLMEISRRLLKCSEARSLYKD